MAKWKIRKEIEIEWEDEFDSAHFLFFDYESKCRRLHGHNWNVKVVIRGFVNRNGVVFDFNHLKEIVKEFDHRTFIPKRAIKEITGDGWLVAETSHGEMLKLRRANVVIIPYDNVTSEFLAQYWVERIIEKDEGNLTYVKVCIEEDPRSKACVEAIKE